MEGLINSIIIDLNEHGVRWEGAVLNGILFGYGEVYNEANNKIYKGFMFRGMKVCYGSEFYGDVEVIEYEGDYYKNMRYGYGRLYDKKNKLIYEGNWLDNNPITETSCHYVHTFDDRLIHYATEEIIVDNNCIIDLSSFHIFEFSCLKRLFIGYNCFRRVREFLIRDCNELREVIIGNDNHNDKAGNSIVSITNCDKLTRITIGYRCFNVSKVSLTLSSILIDNELMN